MNENLLREVILEQNELFMSGKNTFIKRDKLKYVLIQEMKRQNREKNPEESWKITYYIMEE